MLRKNEPILGISSEHNYLALTLMQGGVIKKSIYVDIPENVSEHGEILSRSLFSTLLRDTIKEHGIKTKKAALVISSDHILIRNLTLPKMTAEQLVYNIPFEFRDYIRGELNEYLFDYAYRPPLPNEEDLPTMNVLAVAVQKKRVYEMTEMIRDAGLKLVKMEPLICTYESLLRHYSTEEQQLEERALMDIGFSTTRMFVYKNGRYKLMHTMDIGGLKIRQVLADELNVDMHIAHSYLKANHDNCHEMEALKNVYRDISIEVLKGLNYYEVSDMSSRLHEVVLTGPGARIQPLVDLLKERISMNVETISEAFPDLDPSGVLCAVTPSVCVLLDGI